MQMLGHWRVCESTRRPVGLYNRFWNYPTLREALPAAPTTTSLVAPASTIQEDIPMTTFQPMDPEGEAASADVLRAAMVEQLRKEGSIRSEQVAAAFTRVPRHLFAPEGVPLERCTRGDHRRRRGRAGGPGTTVPLGQCPRQGACGGGVRAGRGG
ncbi:hypothetical protein [Nonomuraea dietziae]|uniref:hypothetical protein n=1 Tax=Nonomuraea dietziae TaxID=65515 RepID=UPI003438A39C